MRRYAHYSFDLWQTLIKGNPLFKEERTRYFYEKYNPASMTFIEIRDVIRSIDIMCNQISETVYSSIRAEDMYVMVLFQLEVPREEITKEVVTKIYQDLEAIFLENPPSIYDENTINVLEELSKTSKIYIVSNTAFIKGITLDKYLRTTSLWKYPNVIIYSDQRGASKPGSFIFSVLKIWTKYSDDVLHVGDNPIADIQGATKADIDSFLINSNDKTIIDLL